MLLKALRNATNSFMQHDIAIMQFLRKPNEQAHIFPLSSHKMTFFTSKQFANTHNFENEITLEQLQSLPFIMFSLKEKSMQIKLENTFGQKLKPIEAPSSHSAYAMVMDEQGIGYFHEEYIDSQKSDQIVKLKIKDMPDPPPNIYECAYNKKPPALVALFIKELKEFYAL